MKANSDLREYLASRPGLADTFVKWDGPQFHLIDRWDHRPGLDDVKPRECFTWRYIRSKILMRQAIVLEIRTWLDQMPADTAESRSRISDIRRTLRSLPMDVYRWSRDRHHYSVAANDFQKRRYTNLLYQVIPDLLGRVCRAITEKTGDAALDAQRTRLRQIVSELMQAIERELSPDVGAILTLWDVFMGVRNGQAGEGRSERLT